MTLSEVFRITLYHGYIPQLLLAETLFTLGLRRRGHFWLRLAAALPVCLALCIAVPNLIAHYVSGLFSMTIFVLSLGLCVFLFANRAADILFCCVCAQLTQNLSYNVENLICLPLEDRIDTVQWLVISVATMAVVYAACYYIFSRRRRDGEEINMGGQYVFPVAVITMLFVYAMQYLFQVYGIDRLWVSRPPLIVCCLFGLSLQYGLLAYKDEREENVKLEYFLQQANRQYEMARGNIDLINMKAHDLKHYIQRVRELSGSGEELREMEDAVRQYEMTVRCGNSTLDVVLTDKLYQCKSHQIDFSMMVQGEELDFVSPSDLVSLFSNALDNAIECELRVEEARRCIALSVSRKGGFVCVHVENYCAEQPELKDGLPVTTKADKGLHGFGIKSMRYVAEKYDGSMQAGTRENMFVLNILLPIPGKG